MYNANIDQLMSWNRMAHRKEARETRIEVDTAIHTLIEKIIPENDNIVDPAHRTLLIIIVMTIIVTMVIMTITRATIHIPRIKTIENDYIVE